MNLTLIIVAAIIGLLRIFGVVNDYYKDVAHYFVGITTGMAILHYWYIKRNIIHRYRFTPLYIVLTLFLIFVEFYQFIKGLLT